MKGLHHFSENNLFRYISHQRSVVLAMGVIK